MNLNTVFPLPAWLTADEKKRYNKMKRPFIAHSRELGIKMDPFLLAHINDYLIGQLLLSRAEMKLQNVEEAPENLLEKLFKQRERLRKNLQELKLAFEEAAVKNTENGQELTGPDPTDQADHSDIPQTPPSNPVRNSHPKAPLITADRVASFMAGHRRDLEGIKELTAKMQALPPVAKASPYSKRSR